MLNTRPTLD